jgi:hypothetical protein
MGGMVLHRLLHEHPELILEGKIKTAVMVQAPIKGTLFTFKNFWKVSSPQKLAKILLGLVLGEGTFSYLPETAETAEKFLREAREELKANQPGQDNKTLDKEKEAFEKLSDRMMYIATQAKQERMCLYGRAADSIFGVQSPGKIAHDGGVAFDSQYPSQFGKAYELEDVDHCALALERFWFDKFRFLDSKNDDFRRAFWRALYKLTLESDPPLKSRL